MTSKQGTIAMVSTTLLFSAALLLSGSEGYGITPQRSIPSNCRGPLLSANPATTSPLFRRNAPTCRSPTGIPRSIISLKLSDNPSQDGSSNKEDEKPSGSGDLESIPTNSSSVIKSLFQKIDNAGQQLKPMALEAKDKAMSTKEDDRKKSVLYTIKSCSLFMLFIIYRGYRGVFVILPAVFSEVYKKMETMVDSPFDDDDSNDVITVSSGDNTATEASKGKFRVALTVSVLAGVITFSYVVSGALRVASKFFKTIVGTSSVEKSFSAAADEMMINEDKMIKLSNKNYGSKDVNGGGVSNRLGGFFKK